MRSNRIAYIDDASRIKIFTQNIFPWFSCNMINSPDSIAVIVCSLIPSKRLSPRVGSYVPVTAVSSTPERATCSLQLQQQTNYITTQQYLYLS